MSGETNLSRLLRTMQPVLQPGEYVFCNLPGENLPADLHPLGAFHEAEGWTVIVSRSEADARAWPFEYVASQITLEVHSDLAAVGLTAAVSSALAEAGISCNVVAAYFHDHLFVPSGEAQHAMRALEKLVAGE